MFSVPPSAPPEIDPPPVSARFVAAYSAAQIGAFIGFVPLLSLLLPLKAAAIAPAGKAELLAVVALWGAITASIANILAGTVSDRARWGRGERWRWIVTGLLATAASYGLIAAANTPSTLLLAVVCLQISLNLMLNPLAAALPELVPDNQKGVVSAYAGLAYPLASLFGALVIGIVLTTESARLLAVVGTMLLLVTPFILAARQRRPTSADPATVDRSWVALWDSDFQLAFLSIFCSSCKAKPESGPSSRTSGRKLCLAGFLPDRQSPQSWQVCWRVIGLTGSAGAASSCLPAACS
jgi:hypothetical protein